MARQYFSMPFVAGENLNTAGHVGIAIAINDNLVANTGKEAAGILLRHSKPKSGETGAIGYLGELDFRAGLAVAKDARVTVTTSGYFITSVVSGGWDVGRCIEAAASGGLGVGIFNFSQAVYDSTSN